MPVNKLAYFVIYVYILIMNILFIHKNFPSQFQYIATVLANDPDNTVTALTYEGTMELKGVKKVFYKISRLPSKNTHPYLQRYEYALIHGQAAASVLSTMKKQGFKPDIIYGFGGWGSTMFVKDIFPDVPLLSYCEWFYNAEGADMDFGGKILNEDERASLRCKNSHFLIDLYSCDACIVPTQWQKQQFPKEFHAKMKVIHDGIDTELCKPDMNARLLIKDKTIELTAQDEVITYGTRGMEPYRGFPQFMEAAEILLNKRPNAHVVIAGHDKVFYGAKPEKGGTYKQLMLNKLNLDMDRVHFVNNLSLADYVKFLQISSAHVYLTYPFVLSWSILNAMAAGCCIIASNTLPVLEVMKDNYNGLLVDFFDVNQLVEKIEYAIDNKDKMQTIRNNARQFAVNNYELRKLLPLQINYLKSLIHN